MLAKCEPYQFGVQYSQEEILLANYRQHVIGLPWSKWQTLPFQLAILTMRMLLAMTRHNSAHTVMVVTLNIEVWLWLRASPENNTKRETGRKAQEGNIAAAKVRFIPLAACAGKLGFKTMCNS